MSPLGSALDPVRVRCGSRFRRPPGVGLTRARRAGRLLVGDAGGIVARSVSGASRHSPTRETRPVSTPRGSLPVRSSGDLDANTTTGDDCVRRSSAIRVHLHAAAPLIPSTAGTPSRQSPPRGPRPRPRREARPPRRVFRRRARSPSVDMILIRSSSFIRGHRAISSPVRWHPTQIRASGWMTQTFTQGDEGSGRSHTPRVTWPPRDCADGPARPAG